MEFGGDSPKYTAQFKRARRPSPRNRNIGVIFVAVLLAVFAIMLAQSGCPLTRIP